MLSGHMQSEYLRLEMHPSYGGAEYYPSIKNNVHALTVGTCECVTLYDKRDCVDMIKVQGPEEIILNYPGRSI